MRFDHLSIFLFSLSDVKFIHCNSSSVTQGRARIEPRGRRLDLALQGGNPALAAGVDATVAEATAGTPIQVSQGEHGVFDDSIHLGSRVAGTHLLGEQEEDVL